MKVREFYYDGGGARFLTRELYASWFRPESMRPGYAGDGSDHYTDTLGLMPWGDFTGNAEPTQEAPPFSFTYSTAETARYLSPSDFSGLGTGGVSARQRLDAQGSVSQTRYFHGDLIGSNALMTDAAGDAATLPGPVPARVAYTAFGEPVVSDGQGGWTVGGELPSGFPRYAYVGAYGYESDLLVLEGAPGTAPIVLSHVGHRWYQANIGRFVQRDPIGLRGGLNVYEYCISSPVSAVDPEGTEIKRPGVAAGAAAVAGGITIIVYGWLSNRMSAGATNTGIRNELQKVVNHHINENIDETPINKWTPVDAGKRFTCVYYLRLGDGRISVVYKDEKGVADQVYVKDMSPPPR